MQIVADFPNILDQIFQFCAQRTRFQLEGVVAELRRLQEQNTEAEVPEDKAEEGGEIAELVHFLEEQRPNTVKEEEERERGGGGEMNIPRSRDVPI